MAFRTGSSYDAYPSRTGSYSAYTRAMHPTGMP
eukprot:SAG22_NODE_3129_length_1915_cov_1.469714_1_plen_32_part_10